MEENKNLEVNNKEQNEIPKKKNNIGLIVVVIGVLLIVVGCGFLISQSMNSEKDNKESNTENKENNTENIEINDNTEVDNTNTIVDNQDNNGEIIEISINDKIKKLYNKYHTEENKVVLSGNTIEKDIYGKDVYNIADMETVPNLYALRILNPIIEKLNQEKDNQTINDDYIKSLVKEGVVNFFGKNIKVSEDMIFGCWSIEKENGVYKTYSGCGDTSNIYANYELTKAEKYNKNIYLYENVTISKEDNSETTNYTYKWTYDLQDDGNYYFLRAERIN